MHVECYAVQNVHWPEFMMNNFFAGVSCSRCGVKLRCKCNPYKVSEPETGECKHDN